MPSVEAIQTTTKTDYQADSQIPESARPLSLDSFFESWMERPQSRPTQITNLLSAVREVGPVYFLDITYTPLPSQEISPLLEIGKYFEAAYPDKKELQLALTSILDSKINPSEYAAFLLASQGKNNVEIAQIQKTSYQTIKNRMHSVFEKLSSFSDFPVENRVTAISLALETGILPEIIPLNFPQLSLDQSREESLTRFSNLTGRENEILILVAQGLDNNKIAQLLIISNQTVRSHLMNVNKKLDCYDRNQATLCYLSAKYFEEKMKSS